MFYLNRSSEINVLYQNFDLFDCKIFYGLFVKLAVTLRKKIMLFNSFLALSNNLSYKGAVVLFPVHKFTTFPFHTGYACTELLY